MLWFIMTVLQLFCQKIVTSHVVIYSSVWFVNSAKDVHVSPVLLLPKVAVSVSVTVMYCAQMTDSIIMQPLPDCSPAILVYPYQMSRITLGILVIQGVKWECVR